MTEENQAAEEQAERAAFEELLATSGEDDVFGDELAALKGTGEAGIEAIEGIMTRMIDAASASVVFDNAVQHNGTIVVPCAEVMTAMGFGLGSGGEGQAEGGGGGGGGGGTSSGRPVAAIIVTPAGASVKPIVDVTKIALAGITTLAFVIYWMFRLGRATGDVKPGNDPSLRDVRDVVRG